MSSVNRDYFYENYYDYDVQPRNYTSTSGAHLHWNTPTRLLLTVLLRVGFVLVQVGSVPVSNVNLILLQNAVDLCCVTVVYFLTGFLIAYNGDVAGLIGAGRWIGDPAVDRNEAIAGWQAVAIASAICTTAVAGRTHPAGYLLVGVLLSGLIQPLLIHWAWTGWMARNELGGRTVAFRDQAGAGVIHAVGGLSGLIGCVVLGRRMLRLREVDGASITPGSAGTVFSGLLLIFAGLQVNTFRPNATSRPSNRYVRYPVSDYVNIQSLSLNAEKNRGKSYVGQPIDTNARSTIEKETSDFEVSAR